MNPKYLFFVFLTFFGAACAHHKTGSEVSVHEGGNSVIQSKIFQSAHNSDFLTHPKLNPTKASVSLNLTGYVDPEVNIERIDNRKTLDIFKNEEARFRVTCNNDKAVTVTFNTKNEWRLLSENENAISYEGVFKGKGRTETVVGAQNNTVDIHNYEFENSEYEFGITFRATERNLKSGKYSDCVTISVSTLY